MDGSSSAKSESGGTRVGPTISPAEWGLLLVLAGIQFTHILDFIIIMPLGPLAMRQLEIVPRQFGLLVSVYGFAACVSSLLAAAVLDRFERKTALLTLYAGFVVSTLLCALAPRFELLVLARTAAGAFGGVVAVAVMTIVGDVFADYRRGTAMGAIMSAFSVASIAGIPAGLWLAGRSGLGAPFAWLAGLSALVWILAAVLLPRLSSHLGVEHPPVLANLIRLSRDANHQRAYVFMTALVISTFTVVPYLGAYIVANAGRSESELPYIYLCGGLCTLVSMNVIGRSADYFPKLTVFRVFAALSLALILLITNLPPVSLAVVLIITTAFMVATSGRMVPAMALITASAAPGARGGFLSLITAVQHGASGAASLIAGLLLAEKDGKITGYPLVGLIAATGGIVSMWLGGRLRSAENLAPERAGALEEPLSQPTGRQVQEARAAGVRSE